MPAHGAFRPGHRSAVKLGFFAFNFVTLGFYAIAALFFVTKASAYSVVIAPQSGTTFNAGSNIPVAIDVSAKGQLSAAAQLPGSGLPNSLESLDVYLISTEANLNVTVGTGLLTQESGSTVKHVEFRLTDCYPTGAYTLMLYEGSRVNGAYQYSITPLPLMIENRSTPTCTVPSNPGQTQAPTQQPTTTTTSSETPATSNTSTQTTHETTQVQETTDTKTQTSTPTGGGSSTTSKTSRPNNTPIPTTGKPSSTNGGAGTSMLTVTVGPSGVDWPFTTTIPTTAPNGDGQTITRTIGGAGSQSTVVVVFESLITRTTTESGPATTATVTTTYTTLSTTTAIMSGTPGSDTAGFFPVAAASIRTTSSSLWLAALATALFALIS